MIVFVSAAKRLWPLTYICISRLLWDVKNILGVTAKYKKSVALGWKSYFKYVSQIPLHYNPNVSWFIDIADEYPAVILTKKSIFIWRKKKWVEQDCESASRAFTWVHMKTFLSLPFPWQNHL